MSKESHDYKHFKIRQTTSDEFQDEMSLSKNANYYHKLIEGVSFSHFIELSKIDDKTKRTFYERGGALTS